MEEAYTISMNNAKIEFETFSVFIRKLKKTFKPLLPVQNTITKLKLLKQTGLAKNYIATF